MLALLLVAAAVLGGALTTWTFDEDAGLIDRLAAGAVMGFTAACLAAYGVASVIGLSAVSAFVTLVLALVPFVVLLRRAAVRRAVAASVRALADERAAVVAVLGLIAFAGTLCVRAFYVDARGICVGDGHNFGDLSLHLAITSDFLYGQRFPPEHPTLGGASLTYPFLVDFGAALLTVGGLPLQDAYMLESTVLLVSLLVLLHRWARLVTADAQAATIAVGLFAFNGGLGGWTFLQDALHSGQGIVGLIGHLPRDYTISGDPAEGLRWGNLLTTVLLTQRAIVLGLGLALVVFTLWWQALAAADARTATRRLAVAGGVAGLLPLAHAHSFLVVLGLGAGVAMLFGGAPVAASSNASPTRTWRPWAAFFAIALAVGLPQVAWNMSGSRLQTGGFLAWQPGWDKGEHAFVTFWLRNSGLLLPLLIAALVARPGGVPTMSPRAVRFLAPFAMCLVIPNLFRLAPWIWDNIKVLVYGFLAAVLPVSALLARLLRGQSVARGAAGVAMVVLTAAGALDVWRVLDGQIDLVIIDRAGIAFAEQVRAVTPPDAMILHGAVPNHPLVLSGRRHLLGYPGHVWSQGLSGEGREDEIKAVYAGAPQAHAILAARGIRYIAVGPQERNAVTVNDGFLATMPVVLRVGAYTLHQVTCPP